MRLGVSRGRVRVVTYDFEWKHHYQQEEKLLADIFKTTTLDIQHVGSTSIEGLAAKPIIDIAIRVHSLHNLSSTIIDQLTINQYTERVNRLGPNQLVFVKGSEDKETHILHIIPSHNTDWDHKLLFRDYLRTHPEVLQAYEMLKQRLSEQFINDRSSYTRGKDQFIRQVLLNKLP